MNELYLKQESGISADQISGMLDQLLAQYAGLKKILVLPPDLTRCYSYAGEITKMLWKKLTPQVQMDIMPAVGTHMELTREEKESFFGPDIPDSAYIAHHWQTDTVKIGTVPGEYCRELSGGLFCEDIDAEVDHLLLDGGYDLILSVGQVVPHEIVGMANYSKNIFVGVGGRSMINKTHMLGAICGIENMLGVVDTPVRKVYDYAQQHFLDGRIPLVYVQTVVIEETPGQTKVLGLFIGDSRRPYEMAAEMAQKFNITHLDRRAKKVVAYLNPDELKTTWVGNKGLYRTRMIVEDGGELILLAPGVAAFGENKEVDEAMRRFGYCGTEKLLKYYNEGAFGDASMAASHLILSSTDGRFRVTYATRPELLSKEEVESVYLGWMDYDEAVKRYDPEKMKEGWNILPDGEEIYFVHTPAIGLWKADAMA